MNTNNMMNRIKKTTVGKVLRRLVGEDAGQAMMEYILIAVLIAAACAAAIAYFGHANAKMAGVAANAATANITEAQKQQNEAQTQAQSDATRGVNKAKEFSKID